MNMPVLNQLIYNVDRGVGLRLDFKVLSKVLIPAFMHTQLIPDCDLLKMRKPFIAFDFKEGRIIQKCRSDWPTL